MKIAMSAALLACTLLAPYASAQPNVPIVFSAVNSASYDASGIAQGSLFVVFGVNLGPPKIVQASSFPLPNQLGGTSITVSSGSTTLNCPMIYSLSGQVAAILPSNTPLGSGSVMLTYNGAQTPFPAPINVLPSSAGIYTLSSSGLGPGVFTGADNTVKTFAVAAKPGDVLTAWATGLGPIGGPDNIVPSTFPNFPGVEVFVGTQSAQVIYAGRSGCCSGVDQVSFVAPANVSGCYVPVSIRGAGKLSNFVTLAMNNGGASCSDTAPTVPAAMVNRAIAGQQVTTAAIAIGPLTILRGAGFNLRQYVADRLSELLHVRVSQDDAGAILRSSQRHDRRLLARTMMKYAAAWKALDARSKATVGRALSLTQEGASAAFGVYSTAGALSSAVGALFPSQGSCTVAMPVSGSLGSSGKGLDAGPSLALSGQVGSWTLTPTSAGQYQVVFGSSPVGPNVPPGAYTLSGAGGKDVGPFSASLTVPSNLTWTNESAISSVDRSQPLTITWSGGTTPGYVLLGGYADSSSGTGHAAFVCSEDASKGTFTIPSFILSALLPTTSGIIFIGPHPLSHQVTIPGIDLAYFADGSTASKSVAFR